MWATFDDSKMENYLNVPESMKAARVSNTKIAKAAPIIITFIVKGSLNGDLLLTSASYASLALTQRVVTHS